MKPSHLRIQRWVNSKGGKNLEPHQGVKPRHTVPLYSWSPYCQSKILNLLNPETEHTQLVNILCDKLGNTHKAFLLHTKVWWVKKKHLNNCLLQAESSSQNRFFVSKNWQTDYLDLIILDIFSEMNEAYYFKKNN